MASEHLVPHRKEEKPQSRLMGKGQAEKAGREGVSGPEHSSSSQACRKGALPYNPAHGPGTPARSSHTGSGPESCSPCGRCLQGQKNETGQRSDALPRGRGTFERETVPQQGASTAKIAWKVGAGVCLLRKFLAPQEDDLIGGAHL